MTPFEAVTLGSIMGILFNQAPLSLLDGKDVKRNKALNCGAGFSKVGYCKFGKAVGICSAVTVCGMIWYLKILLTVAVSKNRLLLITSAEGIPERRKALLSGANTVKRKSV